MNEIQLVTTIKVLITKGDKASDKAQQYYTAAGQHLKTLKAGHTGSWAEWEQFLKDKIGIGKSRASELMQIADGRKTAEQVRTKTNTRKVEHRKNSPFRNGEATQKAAEIEDLRRQLAVFKSPVRCEFVEDDGGRAAAGYGEPEADCVARAIAIATCKPYAEVFEALKAGHAEYVRRLRPGSVNYSYEARRRSEPINNGCTEKIYGPYLRSLGWEYTRLTERTYLRAGALPSGRLIVSVQGHLVALIDGVIHDAYDSGGAGKRPVFGYYRATKQIACLKNTIDAPKPVAGQKVITAESARRNTRRMRKTSKKIPIRLV